MEFFCTLGISCSVDITGYDLDSTNQIVILGSGSCGGQDAQVVAWGGQALEVATGYAFRVDEMIIGQASV